MRISLDIEDAVREILNDRFTVYCRPLPKTYPLPSLLVTNAGGSVDEAWDGQGKIDTFRVVIDCRGETEKSALDTLRNAIGYLKDRVASQTTPISNAKLIANYSWGTDPVRPELSMCSATFELKAHLVTINN